MIETLKLVELEPCKLVAIHLDIPREKIADEIHTAIEEILSSLTAQNIAPSGPLTAHHITVSASRFNIEVGFPVSTTVKLTGRVRTIELGSMKALSTTYQGPYEGLYQAWTEFGDKARSREYELGYGNDTKASLREVYRVGPETTSDSKSWQTDLFIPIGND